MFKSWAIVWCLVATIGLFSDVYSVPTVQRSLTMGSEVSSSLSEFATEGDDHLKIEFFATQTTDGVEDPREQVAIALSKLGFSESEVSSLRSTDGATAGYKVKTIDPAKIAQIREILHNMPARVSEVRSAPTASDLDDARKQLRVQALSKVHKDAEDVAGSLGARTGRVIDVSVVEKGSAAENSIACEVSIKYELSFSDSDSAGEDPEDSGEADEYLPGVIDDAEAEQSSEILDPDEEGSDLEEVRAAAAADRVPEIEIAYSGEEEENANEDESETENAERMAGEGMDDGEDTSLDEEHSDEKTESSNSVLPKVIFGSGYSRSSEQRGSESTDVRWPSGSAEAGSTDMKHDSSDASEHDVSEREFENNLAADTEHGQSSHEKRSSYRKSTAKTVNANGEVVDLYSVDRFSRQHA